MMEMILVMMIVMLSTSSKIQERKFLAAC